jgi:hypothetical protein
MSTSTLPVVALTLGDPAGIGAELIAKLLAKPEAATLANIVLVGDRWLWEEGQRIAGVSVATDAVRSLAEVRGRAATGRPAFLETDTITPSRCSAARRCRLAARSVLRVLDLCMDATTGGAIDAICFAPLNKQAMKIGGLQHEDELHHFAQHLGVTGYFCEFNTLGELWTSRISSHVPLKDVASYLSVERIEQAARADLPLAAGRRHGAAQGGHRRLQPARRRRRAVRPRGDRHHHSRGAKAAGAPVADRVALPRPLPRRHHLPEGAGRRLPGQSSPCTTTRARSRSS